MQSGLEHSLVCKKFDEIKSKATQIKQGTKANVTTKTQLKLRLLKRYKMMSMQKGIGSICNETNDEGTRKKFNIKCKKKLRKEQRRFKRRKIELEMKLKKQKTKQEA